jgi:choline transport protein
MFNSQPKAKGFGVEVDSDQPENGIEMQNLSKLGGTNNDENEMAMLGKTQQLNV